MWFLLEVGESTAPFHDLTARPPRVPSLIVWLCCTPRPNIAHLQLPFPRRTARFHKKGVVMDRINDEDQAQFSPPFVAEAARHF